MNENAEAQNEDTSNTNQIREEARDVVIPIVTKEINDVIEFCEPSSSNSYAFKTQIQISITGEPKISNRSICSIDAEYDVPFGNKFKEADEESYTTVDACVKEKETNTIATTTTNRTERIEVADPAGGYGRYEPPPAYNYNQTPPPPAYSGQQRGQQPVYYTTAPDASRAPAYQRGRGSSDFSSDYSLMFLERKIRHKFIQKVYMILAVQLLFTVAFVALAMMEKNVNRAVRNILAVYLCFMVLMVGWIAVACCECARRVFPLNFFMLAMITAATAYITAGITVMYDTKIVLITFAATAFTCILVSILACQTKFDITKCAFIIVIATIIFMVFGLVIMIVALFGYYSKVTYLIYSCLATLLFVVYLMFDTQLIFGGRSMALSPEEYILGALILYRDIVYIFIHLITIIGYR